MSAQCAERRTRRPAALSGRYTTTGRQDLQTLLQAAGLNQHRVDDVKRHDASQFPEVTRGEDILGNRGIRVMTERCSRGAG
jgi:hypothetical protein